MDQNQVIVSVVRQVLESIPEQAEVQQDKMTLALARALIARVEKKAAEMGVNAVTAVANAGARPVAVACMDDSFIASYDIALNKAYTSVALKMATKELKPLAQPGAPLYGVQQTNQGQIVIFGGGVPLYNREGRLIGGLGVSGGTEEQDTALADFGGANLQKR